MKWINGPNSTRSPVGVTICNEAYRSRAELAANQFIKCTGCTAVIIEEQDFFRIRHLLERFVPRDVPEKELPLAAKLFLFDLLDSDWLVYFDADLLFLRSWNPEEFVMSRHLCVVRDFWWNPGVIEDCRRGQIEVDRYFNAGMMPLNRERDTPWLRESARLYGSFPMILLDQTALNVAAQDLGIAVKFLSRDYNMIKGADSDELGAFAVIGLHLMGDFPGDQYENVLREFSGRGRPCLSCEGTGIAGLWSYDRVGIGRRSLELRPDGTIGFGTAGCERFWRAWEEDGRTVLGVFGHATGEDRITKTFEALFDDDCWRGRWLRFEKNEVVLSPQRAEVVVRLFRERASQSLTGAEIGVDGGVTSEWLLRSLPGLRLHLVDSYTTHESSEAYRQTGDHLASRSQQEATAAMQRAKRMTERYRDRRVMLVNDFRQAAQLVTDESLDFVFLDADHSYEGTWDAIQAWLPKVKRGGIVAGHDYCRDFPGVVQAADQLAATLAYQLSVTYDDVWWLRKK